MFLTIHELACPVFYKAFQHYFFGFPASVRRLSCNFFSEEENVSELRRDEIRPHPTANHTDQYSMDIIVDNRSRRR